MSHSDMVPQLIKPQYISNHNVQCTVVPYCPLKLHVYAQLVSLMDICMYQQIPPNNRAEVQTARTKNDRRYIGATNLKQAR